MAAAKNEHGGASVMTKASSGRPAKPSSYRPPHQKHTLARPSVLHRRGKNEWLRPTLVCSTADPQHRDVVVCCSASRCRDRESQRVACSCEYVRQSEWCSCCCGEIGSRPRRGSGWKQPRASRVDAAHPTMRDEQYADSRGIPLSSAALPEPQSPNVSRSVGTIPSATSKP
jgi:hypothetical protein